MSDTDNSHEKLRQKLLTLQTELTALKEHEAASDSTVELDQSRVGRLTRMDALAGAAMNQETSRRRALQLKLITVALLKMDSGGYGECDECLEPINPQRLSLNPAVQYCIKCATQFENEQR